MSAPSHSGVVLVADDDSATRTNLVLLLRSEGYSVREAADGLAASEALADPAISAALLDLKMPKQDGLAVLRDHADRLDEVPVIVITAYGGSAAAIEAMKLGAYDYITKPFDLDEILFTLRRALTHGPERLTGVGKQLSQRSRSRNRDGHRNPDDSLDVSAAL
jgi:two-component system, NtrC family, response regulator AtoC